MLRIGRIAYSNCTPLFLALQRHFPTTGYSFVHGVPAELNAMLRTGKIDVCPSSSFEYALNPERYQIFPHLSISSSGAVKSVLLFSSRPIHQLDNTTICVSTESATSVNLLKVLMQQYIGCSCNYIQQTPHLAPPHHAMLLIGDAALKQSLSPSHEYVYDLGQLWHDWTGLPFVFALWLCSRASVEKSWHELCFLNQILEQAKRLAATEYESSAELSPEVAWMGREALIDYWRSNISYELDQEQVCGLQLYYEKLFQAGLIPAIPELVFLTAIPDKQDTCINGK